MRRIYWVFILIFGTFIALELNFVPSEKAPFISTKTDAQVQHSGFLGLNNPISVEENFVVNDTMTWSLLGKIKYENKPHKDYTEEVLFTVLNDKPNAKNSISIATICLLRPYTTHSYS